MKIPWIAGQHNYTMTQGFKGSKNKYFFYLKDDKVFLLIRYLENIFLKKQNNIIASMG